MSLRGTRIECDSLDLECPRTQVMKAWSPNAAMLRGWAFGKGLDLTSVR